MASPDDFAVGFAPLCAYVKRLLLAFALYFRLHQVKCLMNLLNAFGLFLSRQGVRRWLRLMNLPNAFGLFLSRQGVRRWLRLMNLLNAFGLFLSCQGYADGFA